jgi:hypothetical protein
MAEGCSIAKDKWSNVQGIWLTIILKDKLGADYEVVGVELVDGEVVMFHLETKT